MKSLLTIIFLHFLVVLSGQTPYDLIPRELFFKEKDKTGIRLSMDGETVFYQKSGNPNELFYISAGSPQAERSEAFEGEIVDYRPVYDDGLVIQVRQDTNLQLLYTTVRSESTRELELMPFQRLEFVHLSERFPNKIGVRVEAKDPGKSGVYILDVLNSNLKRLGKMDEFQEVYFDQNFSKIAAMRPNDAGGNTLLRYHEGEWKTVFDYPFHPEMFIGGLSKIVSVSTDGKTIYATDNFEKDKTTLVAIDVETGEVTELASDPDADILPYAASINSKGKPTSVVALWADTRRHFPDEAVQKDFAFLEKELEAGVSYAGASSDDNVWLVRTIDGGPFVYHLFDRRSQQLTRLFSDYSYLDEYDLASRKAYTVETRDGMKLPVHIYVPPGMAKGDGSPRVPLPTIVYIHGGPWAGVTHWNGWFHNCNFQLLANRGYVVINMEFRGTTGLGKKVCDAGDLQWGAGMHQDIVDVVTWATRSGISNPKRVGIWGWSYGGYAASYALGAAPDLFACGVSMYGIPDLYEFTKLPFADNDTWRNRVGDPNTEEGEALLKSHSPTTYLKSMHQPLLLTTGSKDERVPKSHVDAFAKSLDEAGKEVVYFYYPEEVHDYRQPESWISFWAITEHFLHKHVGGRKELRKEDIEKGNFVIEYGAGFIEEIE